MHVNECKRLSDDCAKWPEAVPKRNRTDAYYGKCRKARYAFDRHVNEHFMIALGALRRIRDEAGRYVSLGGNVESRCPGWLERTVQELEEVKEV
jgi:hypothetical protein